MALPDTPAYRIFTEEDGTQRKCRLEIPALGPLLYDRPLHSKCNALFAPVHEAKGFQCVDAEFAQFSD